MTKTTFSLLFSFVLSCLTAQTFHNEYYNATFNISEGTGSFKANGLLFEGELLSKEMKSYPYSTWYCLPSKDGSSTLLFSTQLKLREGSDNKINELYIVDLPQNKALKLASKGLGNNFSYSMNGDLSLLTDYNTIRDNIDKIESEENRLKRLERERLQLEKQKLFVEETNLSKYIGTYNVKIGYYGGSNVSSLDFSAKLYVTEEGISLIGDFLTQGKLSGTYKKEKALLDFEDGTFECYISVGFGDEMIVTMNETRTAGSISRLSGNRPYDTITFNILDH